MWNFEKQVLVKFCKIKFNTFRGNTKLPDHTKTNLSKKLVNIFGYYQFFAFCCMHVSWPIILNVKFWTCYLVQTQDLPERVPYKLSVIFYTWIPCSLPNKWEVTSKQQPHFLTVSYKSKSVTLLNQNQVLQKVLCKYKTNTTSIPSNFTIQE